MNSKILGNNFERNFSKKLSLWASNGQDDNCFWRDLSSGARSTTRKKQGKDSNIKADIISVDFKYKPFTDLFYLDTKSYKEFNSFIINPKNLKSNKLFLQWVKTVNECPQNMFPVMPCNIRDRITPDFIIVPYDLIFYCDMCQYYEVSYDKKRYCFYLVLQDDFFKNNNWEILVKENLNIEKK